MQEKYQLIVQVDGRGLQLFAMKIVDQDMILWLESVGNNAQAGILIGVFFVQDVILHLLSHL